MTCSFRLIFLILLSCCSFLAQDKLPRFEDYQVSVYTGKMCLPEWARREKDDCWRDQLGKCIGEHPEVNFSGKYFAIVHSCGTSCRYFTLTDLSTGRELKALDMFGSGESPSRTRNGLEYLTGIVTRPNSRLLIAQYEIQQIQRSVENSECRERSFLFDGERLKPITSTRRSCRKF